MKTLADLQAVYHLPLPELLYQAATVHREHHDPADIQRCVANMEASLPHGHSILGSRDTAIYIQDRGNLDDMGFTEYDVMVGRCMDKSYHRFISLKERQPLISLKERQPRKWRRSKNLRRARPEITHTDFVRVSRARCNMTLLGVMLQC